MRLNDHLEGGCEHVTSSASARLVQHFGHLLRDSSGTSLIEFAFILPVILTMGAYGTETAQRSIVDMQVSQLALSVADNASRLGQTDNAAVVPTITEVDVDSVMFGALEQGSSIGIEANGRIILSSLERDTATGEQFIHWQRCRGDLDADSDYGTETPGGPAGAGLAGMGQSTLITARAGSAVMYVEVEYEYEPLFDMFSSGTQIIRQEAAFVVRDDRNLTPGITGNDGQSGC